MLMQWRAKKWTLYEIPLVAKYRKKKIREYKVLNSKMPAMPWRSHFNLWNSYFFCYRVEMYNLLFGEKYYDKSIPPNIDSRKYASYLSWKFGWMGNEKDIELNARKHVQSDQAVTHSKRKSHTGCTSSYHCIGLLHCLTVPIFCLSTLTWSIMERFHWF